MKEFIYHTLKGINGWSKSNISTIDIYKINHLYYKKRSFCIFDKKYPYKLIIEYNDPIKFISIGLYDITITPIYQLYLHQLITKRYKTENDVLNEINEINNKITKLKSFKQ